MPNIYNHHHNKNILWSRQWCHDFPIPNTQTDYMATKKSRIKLIKFHPQLLTTINTPMKEKKIIKGRNLLLKVVCVGVGRYNWMFAHDFMPWILFKHSWRFATSDIFPSVDVFKISITFCIQKNVLKALCVVHTWQTEENWKPSFS